MKINNLSFRIVVLFIALSIVEPLFAKLQSDDFNGSKLRAIWKIDNPIANVLQAKMEGFYFQWCQDIIHC